MAPLTLLRGVDAYAPAPLGRKDLLLGGDRILAIEDHVPVPQGLEVHVVDGAGLRAIPGLVDAHTHLTGGGGEGGAETRVPPMVVESFRRAGVTTAIGLLGTDCTTRSIEELLACARGLEAQGLRTFCYTGGYMVPPRTLTGSVRGDIVHVDRIIAVGETAISDHRSSQPTFEELVRLAADAHVAGMMTKKAGLLHLHLGDGDRKLSLVRRALAETELPPRVFHPTHCNRNRPLWEDAKALSKLGCTIDVTAFDADGDAPDASGAFLEWRAEGLDPTRLTISSDGGGCLPTFDKEGVLLHMDVGSSETLLHAVRALLSEGVPLSEAIAPMTVNVAKLFRLRDRGELRVGLLADVVLLDDRGFVVRPE
jgi:beta-aspartyl-dipeptidase (metallo-type)